jgi:hypothetical protein
MISKSGEILMAGIFNTENNPHAEHLRTSVEEILQRLDALPTTDPRTADEILGYDKSGLPSLYVAGCNALSPYLSSSVGILVAQRYSVIHRWHLFCQRSTEVFLQGLYRNGQIQEHGGTRHHLKTEAVYT